LCSLLAGLKFISNHAVIFKEYLTEDSEKMFQRLFSLCKHQNKNVRDLAFPAFESFMAQVSNEISSGNRNAVSDQATFTFFIRKFYDLLNSSLSGIYEISVAIRGLGYFATPIEQFTGQNELKKVFIKLLKQCQQFCSGYVYLLKYEIVVNHFWA
jgi:DNA-dependent protein kinase catalytic subunit